MPFDGNGAFDRAIASWVTDSLTYDITASRFDTEHDGFATGLSNCICKDGQTTITANIPFNTFKITGLGDATAAKDALNRDSGDARYCALGAYTFSLGGNFATGGAFTTSGAYALTFTLTNTTSLTLPTSGTLAKTTSETLTTPIIKGSTPVTLTDGATPALDASLGNIFLLTAAGNRTIAVPTNATTGQKIIIVHKASGADRTLALNTGAGGFRFGTDITTLTATTSAKTDYIGCIYNAADSYWDVVAVTKGF